MAVEPDLESNMTRGTKSVGNKKPTDDSKPFVGPEDGAEHDIGEPGEFPYTRGIHHTMYTERLWTMRQFAGFGSAEDTNQRFKFLLEKGQTGLSTAFDLPTLMGRDADDPLALGEAGKCGVSIRPGVGNRFVAISACAERVSGDAEGLCNCALVVA